MLSQASGTDLAGVPSMPSLAWARLQAEGFCALALPLVDDGWAAFVMAFALWRFVILETIFGKRDMAI